MVPSTEIPSQESRPEEIIRRPDIGARHYGAIAYHALNLVPDSEPRAFNFAFHSGDIPDAAFDVIVNGYLNHLAIAGSSALIPEQRKARFGEGAEARSLSMNALGAGVGGALVVKMGEQAYMNFLALLGGGFQHRSIELENKRLSGLGFIESMNARIGVGSRGTRQSVDLKIVWDVWRSSVRNVRLDSSNLGLVLSCGVKI